jgi:acyl carrier protein
MNYGTTARILWIVFFGVAFGTVGCGDRKPTTPVAHGESSSTADEVCAVTAKLFRVDRSKVRGETTLADLGADELDFVELVMELEEHFNISIPDETAKQMAGTDNWQQGMKNVTMSKVASVIDERRQISQSDSTKSPHGIKHMIPVSPQVPVAKSGLPAHEESQATQVKVFLNPLVMLLAGAEKQKGQPLTREEVLEVRDNAAFVMMSPEQARRFYGSLDAQVPVHRINPDRVWEEWQEIRSQLK